MNAPFVVYLRSDAARYEAEISYCFKLLGKNINKHIQVVAGDSHQPSVGFADGSTIRLAQVWDKLLQASVDASGIIRDSNHTPDLLASVFYLVNSLQEYTSPEKDELGRFRYQASYQYKHTLARHNLVQQHLNEICRLLQWQPSQEKTKFFLSHDIDSVYGAWLEDGFYVLKKGRVDLFLAMLFRMTIARPDWLNMDQIMKLEDIHGCKSTFFWLVKKGRINQRERNADYRFRSPSIQKIVGRTVAAGFGRGIHKSISDTSLADECHLLGAEVKANRYHYLKFNLPQAWREIESAELAMDASLGFADAMGFRNSYGLPFNPYSFETNTPHHFIEVPLHVMDRTFFQYQKNSPQHAATEIIDFFEANRTSCVISVLWHNNFFSNYKFKGYGQLYQKILGYIHESKSATVIPEELISRYSFY
ncbi:MAG: hypothetical protein JST43_13275 [Bacteroidetes bacterium]|nr:hypothetical protein [Bacteroidota bacterium]MBS1541804.1 hypothetical protein [Bacteroidota bacterium]